MYSSRDHLRVYTWNSSRLLILMELTWLVPSRKLGEDFFSYIVQYVRAVYNSQKKESGRKFKRFWLLVESSGPAEQSGFLSPTALSGYKRSSPSQVKSLQTPRHETGSCIEKNSETNRGIGYVSRATCHVTFNTRGTVNLTSIIMTDTNLLHQVFLKKKTQDMTT